MAVFFFFVFSFLCLYRIHMVFIRCPNVEIGSLIVIIIDHSIIDEETDETTYFEMTGSRTIERCQRFCMHQTHVLINGMVQFGSVPESSLQQFSYTIMFSFPMNAAEKWTVYQKLDGFRSNKILNNGQQQDSTTHIIKV